MFWRERVMKRPSATVEPLTAEALNFKTGYEPS